MANISKLEREVFITIAAGFFALETRDAKVIGDKLGVSSRTVLRYAKEPRWAEVLNVLGYEGEMNFRINPRRTKKK